MDMKSKRKNISDKHIDEKCSKHKMIMLNKNNTTTTTEGERKRPNLELSNGMYDTS